MLRAQKHAIMQKLVRYGKRQVLLTFQLVHRTVTLSKARALPHIKL